jgi:hypothetical protein
MSLLQVLNLATGASGVGDTFLPIGGERHSKKQSGEGKGRAAPLSLLASCTM